MAGDLEEILQKFVPKKLYDELRRDYDRLLVRLGRMEEQLLMLSEYRLEPEEETGLIDRKIRRAERSGRRRARDLAREHEASAPPPAERRGGPEKERERRRAWDREAGAPAGGDLDEGLEEESTEELIRRLRRRYREISRLRDRLREEEE